MSDQPKNISDLGYQSVEEFVDMLDKMARSIGYEYIRDNVTPQVLKEIRNDIGTYEKFQDIRAECKKSYEYDHKVPSMLDVNRGLTNLYKITLNLMKASKNDTDARLDEVCLAINKIEEKIGLEKTDWNGGTEDVTSNTNDGEGIPPDSDGAE